MATKGNFQSNTGWCYHLLKLTKPWDDSLASGRGNMFARTWNLKEFCHQQEFWQEVGCNCQVFKIDTTAVHLSFFVCFLNHCSQHWVLFLMSSFSFTLEWFCPVDLSGVESLPQSLFFTLLSGTLLWVWVGCVFTTSHGTWHLLFLST